MKLITGVWLAMVSMSAAQEVVDGSSANVDAAVLPSVVTQVSEIFRDPSSVQFRNLRLEQGGAAMCGEVNAKNSFAAYVGFMPFLYRVDGETVSVLDVNDPQYRNSPAKFKLANMGLQITGCTDEFGTFIE